ncbi:MAG: hypothetical protein Q9220_006627 [cf. Caloplaca sp. 1 TL-2023]
MDISQAASQLLADQTFLKGSPPEIIDILRSGSNTQYLDALAILSLQKSFTSTIFSTHHALSVELCSRWLSNSQLRADTVEVFAALARILPTAPYLRSFMPQILHSTRDGPLAILMSRNILAILEIPEDTLQNILLALYRFLSFENETFAHLVTPAQLQLVLGHASRPIRYLAIRILCLYLHASDAILQEMLNTYLGREEIQGSWEDKTIDYTFFSLWEDERLEKTHSQLDHVPQMHICPERRSTVHRVITNEDWSCTTIDVAGVLLPRLDLTPTSASSLILTHTVKRNMQTLAEAVRTDKPVLLSGLHGAGKSSLVRDLARRLGREELMVVLHLNEQTDAKILIGMYTSAGGPGTFAWQPGVLTKAVMEGRWVIIEDYDRAPAEIVSMLLPLLERRELLVPYWGEAVRAAPGFKLIATIRSHDGAEGGMALPRKAAIGARYWRHVHAQAPPDDELGEILVHMFPVLHAYKPRILGLYSRLRNMQTGQPSQNRLLDLVRRPIGPQDLIRWSHRMDDILKSSGVRSGHEPISETSNDSFFLEAVDCLAGSLPAGISKNHVVDVIAQELQFSAERVAYCLEYRKPAYSINEKLLQIGRTALPKKKARAPRTSAQKDKRNPFATTRQVLCHLESLGISVKFAEPCLLIGETGSGKTTLVQQLAESLNRKLTVTNLSQQSEAGDLLGGYKPVNIRILAMPLKEEFEDLFELTLPSKKNLRYIEHIGKAISKSRWPRALALWREAAKMIDGTFKSQLTRPHDVQGEPTLKKRKTETPKLQALKGRWESFSDQLTVFQKHIESGSKGFAFSFVEGNIVKAARNGDWVLLDEINLAAPDTLDVLADLLTHGINDHPSLLLTETGETERIRAHKDFRIFAAMNPANDIGKRDLPAGIRSRFSELFIEAPDKDIHDLIPLIQTYLGNHSRTDSRVSSDVASLYLEIQSLGRDNRLVDGADQKPHFSLRTLSRTLLYVLDIAPMYGLRRALFEGFSMSFLTSLNQASAVLVRPLLDKYLFSNSRNSRALLLQVPRLPQNPQGYIKFRQYWLTRGSQALQDQAQYVITPFIERNLLNLVRATSTRRFPVLLQGPTSTGKTSMVEYLAKISGHKFVRINNHEHTDLQEYLGTYASGDDGQLRYQEGILVQALREGFWIVLDELNLAPSDVLEALNRLLDDNRELLIPETQQIVRPHENFMLFATQNPPGMYGGRKVLSRAFRNRFLELHYDNIPEDELEVILRERSQIAPTFCTKIVAVYQKLALHRQHSRLFERKDSFATLRDLFRWAYRDADDRDQLAVNGYHLLAERVRDNEDRIVVKQTIEETMRSKIDVDAIYGAHRLSGSESIASEAYGIVWTRSMRRLYVLVTEALKSREPVLLVGDTGSGKTTICQVIAAVMQTQLHVVNAHQNMETGDLIGSQRPTRSRHLIEARLRKVLLEILSKLGNSETLSDFGVQGLIETYNGLAEEVKEDIPAQIRRSIDDDLVQYNTLFEWADGSLVHAMKAGHHFLLDEISLADDSVLERLNSVLEPDRKLFLAEKGVDDSLVTAAEGFQFLATMNPGGDYGKKELSPALRNRFTEIWVPHASDQDELEDIVRHKLGQSQAHFAVPMVAFAYWYGNTWGNTDLLVSIRDLLAWVAFLNTQCISDISLLLLHGAALVYIDALGANPAANIRTLGSTVEEQRQTCLVKLSELFHKDMAGAYWAIGSLACEQNVITIGPFSLPRHKEAALDPRYSFLAPTTARNATKIARALQLPRPVLLEGSPGVGKTTLVEALAQACGMPLTRINLSDQTDLMDLFGSDVPVEGGMAGQFTWRDAPFLRAMQNGEWVLLDEMNLASQSVLEGLNACFDHRGQVYVAELDHTFTRHPSFVVFAAQNPSHQGSGRKGLPASFVNRFTVVYADTFRTDDLFTICTDKHPEVSPADIRVLTECVSDIGNALQQDRLLGTQGGPWEINLRDTSRWLDLISSSRSSLPSGKAEDFAAVLFLQRFRTFKDVDVVQSILTQRLPQLGTVRHRTVGVHSDHIQVGLGLLSRQWVLSLLHTSCRSLPLSHLSLVESIMLCVGKAWSVLLVGPSGSGKIEIIRNLAQCTGADLVELSMNAEMDTTDLIGSYEQMDHQRERTAFIRRLKTFVIESRLKCLCSSHDGHDILAKLEDLLLSSSPQLSAIVALLQKHNSSDLGLDVASFLQEGKAIIAKSVQDNRARFEWIDGMLVRAVVEGKWLVLDNANLCNPSVLDRLNSLLEPDGQLNINERHLSDGSTRLIKPHSNFRLFLTMDPKHGELSRAMRNRNTELFISAEETSVHQGLRMAFDSSLARFKEFQRLCSVTMEDPIFSRLIWIFLDHLAFLDHYLIERWFRQVSAGLVEFMSDVHSIVFSAIKQFAKVLAVGENLVHSIQNVYRRLSANLGLPQGFEGKQSFHPLNNSAFVNFNPNQFLQLRSLFELLMKAVQLDDEIASIAQGARATPIAKLSRLQRSIMSSMSNRYNEDSTRPLAPLLAEGVRQIKSAVDQATLPEDAELSHAVDRTLQENDISALQDLLSYTSDLVDVAHSPSFDEAVFQVYMTLGKELIASLQLSPRTEDIARTVGRLFAAFNSQWELRSGQSMTSIWSHFRPPTASAFHQLDFVVKVEQLAERFETLMWTSEVPLERLKQTRQMLAELGKVNSPVDSRPSSGVEDIVTALENLEAGQYAVSTARQPYFQDDFEALRQYEKSSADQDNVETRNILKLLAWEPVPYSMDQTSSSIGWQSLSGIISSTGITKDETALATIQASFPTALLAKLEYVSEVPLDRLELLQKEVQQMGEHTTSLTAAITEDPLFIMSENLRRLHFQMAIAHQEYLQAEPFLGSAENPNMCPWQVKGELQSTYFLCDIIGGFLQPSWTLLAIESADCSLEKLATAWTLLFLGCLRLYVPDHPYDPAIRPMIIRERYKKRIAEKATELSALQQYEQLTTGQNTNLRCQLLEKEMVALGGEPTVHAILRPRVSEIGQLQGEFTSILQSVINRAPDQRAVTCLFRGDMAIIPDIELLRSNISQSISRLRQGPRVYDDITMPLIAMLHGLKSGLSMVMLAAAPSNGNATAMRDICLSTPFLGGGSRFLSHIGDESPEICHEARFDSRMKALEAYGVMRSISNNVGVAEITSIFRIFHGVYGDWKSQLNEEQQKDLIKSSTYRYRGAEADTELNDDRELQELFPTVEVAANQPDTSAHRRLSPREVSLRLARYHRDLFESSQKPSDRILDLVRSSTTDLARIWKDSSSSSRSPIPVPDLLCGLILKLDESVFSITRTSPGAVSYNFYTDANIFEAQKLVLLVRRVQVRFFVIKQAWPEHATLDDVLRTSSELLALRHTEPLARLITKVEQLHGYVHEWQTVASREYSAALLYENLTSLIVSWRRLELSTWARLFDTEDMRCEEEVDSWWFVAYEAIVAAPLSALESRTELAQHAKDLFSTLQHFVSDCPIGHFLPRLRLLENFRKYVELIRQSISGFRAVNDVLSQFLAFYNRYSDKIQQALQAGRRGLEKEMKDVLLLASWKDTNVNALRDSAKRSHHKLFKMVRKYRTLLARPAQSIIEQGFPEAPSLPGPIIPSARDHLHLPDNGALQICQRSLDDWLERPARFRSLTVTVSNMVSMSQLQPSMMQMPLSLDNFADSLLEDISSLRKETPSIATDDNEELLKHLMTRKRKLLSDTLKSVRGMGFRSNLSADVLSEQASLGVILAHIPPLGSRLLSDDIKASEYHFHHFLNAMSTVREISRSHSADLNGAEVVRSIGYLESILSSTVKQRSLLGSFTADLANLDPTLGKMENLWKPKSYNIKSRTLDSNDSISNDRLIYSIPHIISVGCIIIEKHGKMGGMDHTGILAGLREWHTRFEVLASTIEQEPPLPTEITSTMHTAHHAEGQLLLESFEAHLRQAAEQYPGLAFVLRQIEQWTSAPPQFINGHSNSRPPLDLKSFDQELLNTCDSILVAIQNLGKTASEVSSLDDRNWLISSEKLLATCVKTLHVKEITAKLDQVMTKLCFLTAEDLPKATALMTTALPLALQYRDICHNVLDHLAAKSRAMNRLAATLAQSFSHVASQGFCNPSKASNAETSSNEKLEDGTGLGEGEGAEDISKDIQDDEDLTELAQEGQKSKDGEQIEDQEDAVNMDQEDLEGEMGDAKERDEDGDEEGSQAGSDGEDGIDEETGDVDDLDPNAVDEKMWDEKAEDANREKEGSKAKGPAQKDDRVHAEAEQREKDSDDIEGEEELSDVGADEDEEVKQQNSEMMDPHAQQEEHLDLPEEMDLDGPERSPVQSDTGDSDLDGLSDVDAGDDEEHATTKSDEEEVEAAGPVEDQLIEKYKEGSEIDQSEANQDEAASPVDTEPESDPQEDDTRLQNQADDANFDKDDVAPSDAQGLDGNEARQETDIQMQENKASGDTGAANENTSTNETQAPSREGGELGKPQDGSAGAPETSNQTPQDPTNKAFKQLGDALERWHRQQRKIHEAPQDQPTAEQQTTDVEMADPDFQHLENEGAKADTQALGAATEDQANALDQRALDTEIENQQDNFPPDETHQESQDEDMNVDEDDISKAADNAQQESLKPSTFIGDRNNKTHPSRHDDDPHQPPSPPSSPSPTPSLNSLTLNPPSLPPLPRSLSSARALWSHHSTTTLPLAQHLCSQLHLILHPTAATKYRGDFRTGKRLNIKKVIPYIASGYKRDKIWMRRSVPSKRMYQIMIAVDDSWSMMGGDSGSGSGSSSKNENGGKEAVGQGGDMAFSTLALIGTALRLLEVGEISILAFGESISVALPFDRPFSAEAGVDVFQHFGFRQARTDVKLLLERAGELFREARMSARGGAGGEEVWQLMFIISDGVFEERDAVARLVRGLVEERVLAVFIVVDGQNAGNGSGSGEGGKGKGKEKEGQSIMDMQEAVFEEDAEGGGERKLRVKRYMDGFPFQYYVVVGDVGELPGVLGQALRGWFGEVVGAG